MNIELFLREINVMRVIDILIVWWLIYRLMLLIRGTKAVTILRGIGILIVVKLVSWYLGLNTISWLTDQIINWGVVALVIIFQPEIRRGLEHLGRSAIIKKQHAYEQEQRLVAELEKAIEYLSKRHIGALITIKMETGLEEYIETGIPIDALVTNQLLINTFIPNTPLHDGAVIIQDNRLAVAAAYLPLSDSMAIPKELGTRHRAGVGISEVTDALTIIVSEETGGVTITRNAELMQDMEPADYHKYLVTHLVPENSSDKKSIWQKLRFWQGGK